MWLTIRVHVCRFRGTLPAMVVRASAHFDDAAGDCPRNDGVGFSPCVVLKICLGTDVGLAVGTLALSGWSAGLSG